MSSEIQQFDKAYRALILTGHYYEYDAKKTAFMKSINRLKIDRHEKNNMGFLQRNINKYHGEKILSIFQKVCSQEPAVVWNHELFVFPSYAITAAVECRDAHNKLKETDVHKKYIESKDPAYDAVMQSDRSDLENLKDKVTSHIYDRIIKWHERKDERSFSLRIQ
jgi:hypothetical protein